MTFYEAALRVLEGEGRPLHVQQITEKSIAQNLLSHVGKMPEVTMLSRLAAMARRARDRRVVVTAKDTFALADWSLPEDAEALAQTGLPVENPEEALPPLRPVERHPEPRSEGARPSGRGERKRRHEEEDSGGRKRRYPPLAEVAFEVLSESAEPLTPAELVERGHRRELNGKDLSREQILSALAEDNQRRLDSGRRLQFFLLEESGQVGLIERSGTAQGMSAGDIQGAFGRALGGAVGAVTESAVKTLKAQAKEARRAAAKAFASRLLSLDAATFERCVVKALQGLGFRDLKVAKRSKEGPLLTARKREGSVELRYAVRLARGSGPVDRRVLQELRRDLGHYAAHVGLVASAADARADARSEAQGGGALVFLWCGEALAEKFFEARAGVAVTTVEVFEPDEPFFDQMRTEAAELQQRREERSGERSRRGDEP
ncbi:MAG TPA: HTH domain-containing protein, partial [Myxococcaceae bacterium]|nr:HTH domain-containing protein [Myxococcaceae bacterium]